MGGSSQLVAPLVLLVLMTGEEWRSPINLVSDFLIVGIKKTLSCNNGRWKEVKHPWNLKFYLLLLTCQKMFFCQHLEPLLSFPWKKNLFAAAPEKIHHWPSMEKILGTPMAVTNVSLLYRIKWHCSSCCKLSARLSQIYCSFSLLFFLPASDQGSYGFLKSIEKSLVTVQI